MLSQIMKWREPDRTKSLLAHWEWLLWDGCRRVRESGDLQEAKRGLALWKCLSSCEILKGLSEQPVPHFHVHTVIALLMLSDWSHGRRQYDNALDAELTLLVECLQEACPGQDPWHVALIILKHWYPTLFPASVHGDALRSWVAQASSQHERSRIDEHVRWYIAKLAAHPFFSYPDRLSGASRSVREDSPT